MSDNLEAPGTDDHPDWGSIYRARGPEVVSQRPFFTGDVFRHVSIPGETEPIAVILVQHPCAIRTDGINLVPRLLAVEVQPANPIPPSQWASGYFKQMPLTELVPEGKPSHYAAIFTKPLITTPSALDAAERVACLSQSGVNLLLQRWVHHNSRAVVSTQLYQGVSSAQYEEADLIEDWCIEREDDGIAMAAAAEEANTWLSRAAISNESNRDLLKSPQHRSAVRKAMRTYLAEVRR